MDIRKQAIENLAYKLAIDSAGIYPKAIKGGKNAYEKRTERMEGYNEAVTEIIDDVCKIGDFIEKNNSIELEDALLNEDIFIYWDEEKNIKLFVNCNDVFYWAHADLEEITIEELKDLNECIKLVSYGHMLWVCRKRKMRPQKLWYRNFNKKEARLFNECGPERQE